MIVLWRVTTRCNLSCAFCACDKRLPFPRMTSDPGSVRRFLDVLADYQQSRQVPVLVSWLGGEPLLWTELPKLTEHATGRGLRVSATTNGMTLAAQSVRRHLLERYSELTISLDSADEGHDQIRCSPGLFQSLRQNVTRLAESRRAGGQPLKLRINTVLMRSTIDRFPALAREVAAWGVDELTFNLLGGRDRPEYFPGNRPLPGQFARFARQLDGLRAELAPLGLVVAGSQAYVDRLSAAVQDIPRPVIDCQPGRHFLYINESGLVSPCSFTTGTLSVPLGDILNARDLGILSDRFASDRRACRPEVCDNCPSTRVFEKFHHHVA